MVFIIPHKPHTVCQYPLPHLWASSHLIQCSARSVLGSVLFFLYAASLSTVIKSTLSFITHTPITFNNTDLRPVIKPQISMQKGTGDVKTWMTVNKLKLSEDKTEAMNLSPDRESRSLSSSFLLPRLCDYIPTYKRRKRTQFIMIFFLLRGSASVPMSDSFKNFGVTLDCHLTMKLHISSRFRTADFEFRRISSIHHVLSTDTTNICFLHALSAAIVCQQHLSNKTQTVRKCLYDYHFIYR